MTEEEFNKHFKRMKSVDSALTIACVVVFVICMGILIITGV